jgi:hypothetical protein
LHLKREQEGKPLNVTVSGGDQFSGAIISEPIVTARPAPIENVEGMERRRKRRRRTEREEVEPAPPPPSTRRSERMERPPTPRLPSSRRVERMELERAPTPRLPSTRGISTSSIPLTEYEDEVFEPEEEPANDREEVEMPTKFVPKKWQRKIKFKGVKIMKKKGKAKARPSSAITDNEMEDMPITVANIVEPNKEVALPAPAQLIRRRVVRRGAPYPSHKKALRIAANRHKANTLQPMPVIEALPAPSNQLALEPNALAPLPAPAQTPAIPAAVEQMAIEAPPKRRRAREIYDAYIVTEGLRSGRKRKHQEEELVPKKKLRWAPVHPRSIRKKVKWASVHPRAILEQSPPNQLAIGAPTPATILPLSIRKNWALAKPTQKDIKIIKSASLIHKKKAPSKAVSRR